MRTSPVLKGFNFLDAFCAAMWRGPKDELGEWNVEVGETDRFSWLAKPVVSPPAISRAADMAFEYWSLSLVSVDGVLLRPGGGTGGRGDLNCWCGSVRKCRRIRRFVDLE